MAEDKYVLRHEWERGQGKLNQRINEVDSKHKDNYNQLLNKVDRQTLYQKQQFESQKRSEKHLESMSESMSNVGTRLTDLEYESKTHSKDIQGLMGTLDQKAKGNTQIIVAWIGVAAVVLPALITLVSQFFR